MHPPPSTHMHASTDTGTTVTASSALWGGGLDLWGVLFTRSFAALVEDLLQVRVCIRV